MAEHQGIKQKIHAFSSTYMHAALIIFSLKWLLLAGLIGVVTGSVSALFLTSLEWATQTRLEHAWLLFLLPFGGGFMSLIYTRYGLASGKGNNLILESIQEGKSRIPLRMGPLVLVGTILTHLFGGSAGREGTAVQMGGSFASWIGQVFKLDSADTKIILMCGMASGFGSVFGTPLAGTLFGLEVLVIGFMRYEALLPCFIASLIGHLTTLAWGVHHVQYSIGTIPEFSIFLLVKVMVASIAFGLTAMLFSQFTHLMKRTYTSWFKNAMVRGFVGGLVIILLVYLFGTRDYLGLSLPLLQEAFAGQSQDTAFLLKILFTSLTLGAGFLGGEVTPLFVIGGTLGSTLGLWLHEPVGLFAALGLIAVFSGAANIPVTSFVLGIELFGSSAAVYMLPACILGYLFSGHTGIYTSQQVGASKSKLWKIHENDTIAQIKHQKHR
ncbi:H+/Cl- antiporter ClcA [Paenibacillus shirakamiensis]|uniref:H+/Cl- antiporter ClcA n=1 Tax=Paenibacillus shirakamiensis TaxID=1265935 RepID=A0ABS4JK55_9BACL|nr:voltage-gated chloride channel family protein [Paenibacillus shirakamiensis]MBP2000984.1 H+/Cl- antiporter ClcA [Paenibacillus shirakamiensis]